MVDIGTQCFDGSSGNPQGSRRTFVHGRVEHRLGCTLELIDGLRCLVDVLELEAIHLTVLHWLKQLTGLTVLVASDNSTVVSYIKKQGGTWSILLCRLIQEVSPHVQNSKIVL